MTKIIKILLFIIVLLTSISCDKKESVNENEISLSKVMGSKAEDGFSKAVEKIKFEFPSDLGSHPGFKTEWWYFTGNVTGEYGEEFGYQFTIFRTALSTEKQKRESEFGTNQIYMGHFTISDISNNKFYYYERFSREAPGLAGVEVKPFKVNLENYKIFETGSSGYDFPKVKISAGEGNNEIQLDLRPEKPVVYQGEEGLSKKGEGEGNASYYYSVTRLLTEGVIVIDNKQYKVNGYSWLDREWSTSALSEEETGWDWFSIQLSNNVEVMYYNLRKKDGTADEYSKGSIVNNNGEKENLSREDVYIQVTDYWKSDEGNKYPSGWILKIPSKDIKLKITPAIKNQELKLSVRYWEGSVKIEGVYEGKPVKGRGYIELTGYTG